MEQMIKNNNQIANFGGPIKLNSTVDTSLRLPNRSLPHPDDNQIAAGVRNKLNRLDHVNDSVLHQLGQADRRDNDRL